MKAQSIARVSLLAELDNGQILERLKVVNSPQKRDLQLDLWLRPGQMGALSLLEGLVVFDEILFDSYAYDSHKTTKNRHEAVSRLSALGLTPTSWPTVVYRNAAKRLEPWNQFLSEFNLSESVDPCASKNAVYRAQGEETAFDNLIRHHHGIAVFADSDQTIARAFLYYELSAALQLGVLEPSRTGPSFTDALGGTYAECVHKLVGDRLKPFTDLKHPSQLTMPYPSLARMIFIQSMARGCSAVETAEELRHTKKATAYRKFLAELHELRNSTAGDRVKQRDELLAELDSVVQQWTVDHSTDYKVTYAKRNLNAKWLPAAGQVVGALLHKYPDLADRVKAGTALVGAVLGDKNCEIRDPILWGGDQYLSFIADWYGADN